MVEKLSKLLGSGDKLGVDPRLITVADMRSYQQVCLSVGATLEWCDGYVDQVWTDRLNGIETKKVQHMADEISGRSVSDKLASVASSMKSQGANHLILSMLDEVAWLLNLRGADIPFNPVFFAFAVLSLNSLEDTRPSVQLFIDEAKIQVTAVSQHLEALQVQVRPYETFYEYLLNTFSLATNAPTVWLDVSKSNALTYVQLTKNATSRRAEGETSATGCHLIEERAPIADMKACKNEAEIEGMKKAHVQDGAALVEFLAWLDETMSSSGYAANPLDENQLAEKEYEFRSRRPGFVGLSFDTISSTGANAAIIHYKPASEGSAKVVRHQIYLNDSGGQYLTGTTDVTRTWHFGNPSFDEIEAYTRVLMGFIGLSRARFPEGANGFCLDVLARNALWQAGMDYKHGTGHGVGHFLNVHEAPPYIGIWRGHDISKMALQPGMCTSIEPGYYEAGHFGIRIENVAFVVKSAINHTTNGQFLEFEQLTMAPIAKNLISKNLLSSSDIDWLNNYHAKVFETLSSIISPSALEWLRTATSPL